MHYTYILECEDGSYYTGYTTDVEKRFTVHLSGKGAKYTRSRRPVRIAYYEEFENRSEALKRERAIKKMTREEKVRLVKSAIENHADINHNNDERRFFMKDLRFFRCEKCKKTFIMIREHGCPTMCCGEEMKELTANTTDGAVEKHVPVAKVEGNKITVNVGSVDHPMLDVHYIEFIALQEKNGFQVKYLAPGEKPCAEFLSEEPVAVYEFCNLHGLWKAEL